MFLVIVRALLLLVESTGVKESCVSCIAGEAQPFAFKKCACLHASVILLQAQLCLASRAFRETVRCKFYKCGAI